MAANVRGSKMRLEQQRERETHIGATDPHKRRLDLDLVRLALRLGHVGVDAQVAGAVVAEGAHSC